MKKVWLVVLLLIFSSICYADDTITGHYCYNYGDNETLKDSRELTKKLAIRNAIESYRIYIASVSKIKNFNLTDDVIDTISTAYLKNVKVTKQSETGRNICNTVEGQVNPVDIDTLMAELKKKHDRKTQSSDSTESLFMFNLINSLHIMKFANDALMAETDNRNDQTKLITDFVIQNNRYKDAQSILSEYSKNIDDKESAKLEEQAISTISNGVITSAEILINANNILIVTLEDLNRIVETAKLRTVSDDERRQFEEIVLNSKNVNAKIVAQRKEAWEMIYKTIILSRWIIWDISIEQKNRNGLVIFNISNEGKKNLINQIERLFGDDIKKYHVATKLRKQKKKHDPEDINFLIAGVIVIRDTLLTKYYEKIHSSL